MGITSRRSAAALVILATAVVLGACGGSSSSSDRTDDRTESTRDDYVDALMSEYSPENVPLTRAQARCFAGASVDAFGVAALRANDVTPKDLIAVEDVATLSRRFGGDEAIGRLRKSVIDEECFPVSALIETQFRASIPTTVSDDAVHCLADGVAAAPPVREVFADLLVGTSTDAGAATAAIDAASPGAAAGCGITLDASTP